MPKKSNTSKSKVDKMSNKEFEQILNEFAKENKIDENNTSPTNGKTPLAESLDTKKKEETRQKLRNAIYMKSQMRNMPSKKKINEETNELKKMMKHPKMNQRILDLYGQAIAYDPKTTLPKPTDILDNSDQYMVEYYQYIRGLIKSMKETNVSISKLDSILDNPYGRYMSACLGCPLNPFKASNSTNITNSESVKNLDLDDNNVPELVSTDYSETDIKTNESDLSNISEEEVKRRVIEELSNSKLDDVVNV
jgi:hypothetical protein